MSFELLEFFIQEDAKANPNFGRQDRPLSFASQKSHTVTKKCDLLISRLYKRTEKFLSIEELQKSSIRMGLNRAKAFSELGLAKSHYKALDKLKDPTRSAKIAG